MEMFRRFVLIGVMVVAFEGTVLQIIVGTLFASLFLFVQVAAS